MKKVESLLLLCFILFTVSLYAVDVGKWRRYVITLPNSSYSGNPFELEVDGTFTHTGTGTVITLPGYYDGNDEWKIAFMPTLLGQWTYVTSSTDPELDGVTGSLNCVASGLPGMLVADSIDGRKWKFTDGPYVVPIALRLEFFSEPGSTSDITAAATFMSSNHIQMLETRLTEETGQFGGRHDFIFQGNWQNHQFDLTIWDRMEQRMEVLTDYGLGGHIMFYSDQAGAPGWGGQSATEALVIRYAIARLASFPVVWFNTGIDVSEYRSQSDIDWFGQQIRNLDPYGHPISSRHGGGSGNIIMSGQTFNSWGDQKAFINTMTNHFLNASTPVSMDDAWGENRPSHQSKNFQPEDIRRAFWKCLLAGGLGGLIRSDGGGCGQDGYFHFPCLAQDLESEQWLTLINPFLETQLGNTFATMIPAPALVSNGYCLADPAGSKLVYFKTGVNDRWDPGNGGDITLKLSSLTGGYTATWFDPRTGAETPVAGSPFSGGSDYVVTPPDNDDWVIFLSTGSDITPPGNPTGLHITK